MTWVATPDPATPDPATPALGRPPRVMVVAGEDCALPLVHGLEREGYVVTWLVSGRDALEHLGRHAAEVVVLDLGLPDGVEVCREIRRRGYAGGLVVVSAGDAADLVDVDLADDHVIRPFGVAELLERVRGCFGRQLPRLPGELGTPGAVCGPKSGLPRVAGDIGTL